MSNSNRERGLPNFVRFERSREALSRAPMFLDFARNERSGGMARSGLEFVTLRGAY